MNTVPTYQGGTNYGNSHYPNIARVTLSRSSNNVYRQDTMEVTDNEGRVTLITRNNRRDFSFYYKGEEYTCHTWASAINQINTHYAWAHPKVAA